MIVKILVSDLSCYKNSIPIRHRMPPKKPTTRPKKKATPKKKAAPKKIPVARVTRGKKKVDEEATAVADIGNLPLNTGF